jgi:hypothetical protein
VISDKVSNKTIRTEYGTGEERMYWQLTSTPSTLYISNHEAIYMYGNLLTYANH